TTYYKYYKKKLFIVISIYDFCFLITTTKRLFDVIEMQIDDTLILIEKGFSILEKNELNKTKFLIKFKKILILEILLIFNEYVLIQFENTI
ncbi:hypothetical protein BDZ45DRAFT_598389, partial [Acephala macrosclerotiorum]